MKYAVFADIHGNYPALKAFIKEVDGKVDGYICLGDVVGYGPDNDVCLETVRKLKNCIYLKGNHEDIFLTKDTGECSQLAREFFTYSFQNFSRFDLLSDKEEIMLGKWHFMHTLKVGQKWLYLYDKGNFPVAFSGYLCLAHTHHQRVIENKSFQAVNIGSVGQNRLNKKIMEWGIYDSERDAIELFQKEYPFQEFIQQMIESGYPQKLIKYYIEDTRND